jgi:hypothetical protein
MTYDNATHMIGDFLRHLNAKDLSDAELFTAKAATFDRMAAELDADGPAFAGEAAECRLVAARARQRAAQR